MANDCYTWITFYGNNKDIDKFYSALEYGTSKEFSNHKCGEDWLGNIAIGTGICSADDIDTPSAPRCRGNVEYYDKYDDSITMVTDTAWVPMLGIWSMMIDKLGLDIQFTYTAEEPGAGIFCTNDPCIAGNYEVDIYGENLTEKYESQHEINKVELISLLQEILGAPNVLDVETLIEKFNNSEFSDEASIHQWEYTETDEWD